MGQQRWDDTDLVVANRGEVAVRIVRAAREEGLRTILLADPCDDLERARLLADQVVELPTDGDRCGFLDADLIARTARSASAAPTVLLHPGYGFLSEDPALARACGESGLTFVGPSPDTLELLGDKASARSVAERCEVPVPRGTGAGVDADGVARLLAEVGGPILIKAVSGGGGRGIEIVRDSSDVADALHRAGRGAARGSATSALYAEELIDGARHIEVQVARDVSGHSVCLGDRDCTVQRRHQKVLEIAPAPNLPNDTRGAMHTAATHLADASGLVGLATVEFLYQPEAGRWVFLEVNPRLQVEHTITEEVTGLDLVRGQFRLAGGDDLASAGLSLPHVDGQRFPRAHHVAVQCRVTSEAVTEAGWIPRTGVVEGIMLPTGSGLRVETHLRPGSEVTGRYDALLLKLIASGPTLIAALDRASRALAETRIDGLTTNLGALRALTTHDAVRGAAIDTAWLERHESEIVSAAAHLLPEVPEPSNSEANDLGHAADASDPGWVHAASAGTVTAVETAVGEMVRAGAPLVIVEAMKMEHLVTAVEGGRIEEVRVAPGDNVRAGDRIARLSPADKLGTVDADPSEINPDRLRDDLIALRQRRSHLADSARPDAVERRHRAGARTARENVADLCAGGSFSEYGALAIAAQRARRDRADLIAATPADGIITGVGQVNVERVDADRSAVAILAYDYTVLAGTQGVTNHAKTDRLLELAERRRLPVVLFTEGGGGRPGDTDTYWVTGLTVPTFATMGRLARTVPTIGIAHGRCFAGNAALFGACDIRIATATANIGMGGPAMIEGGGLGTFSPDEIGPAADQARNGVVDIIVADEAEAVAVARAALAFFQCPQLPREQVCAPDQRLLRQVVPEHRKRVYDVREAITTLVDEGTFLELGRDHAPGMITGLARLEGRTVAVIANNPRHLGGAIDDPEARHLASFLDLATRHELPVVVLCDTPGFMVGPQTEKAGTVRSFAALFAAGAQVRAPLVMVVLRKAYGLGAQAMAGGSLHVPDAVLCWPTAELGPMGLEGAVRLGFRRELDAQADEASRQALERRLIEQAHAHAQAVNAAENFEVDDVIDPAQTRDRVVQILATSPPKEPRA